jgi:DNA-binding LacI/PurR family transcriptional regulator
MSTLLPRSLKSAEADIEDMGAPRELIRSLIQQGHRRIAIVTGPLASQNSLARLEQCLGELESHNVPVCSNHIFKVGPLRPSPAFGRLVLAMESRVRPTAILAWNKRLAGEVSVILDQLGHRVPEDVTVTCLSHAEHEFAAAE